MKKYSLTILSFVISFVIYGQCMPQIPYLVTNSIKNQYNQIPVENGYNILTYCKSVTPFFFVQISPPGTIYNTTWYLNKVQNNNFQASIKDGDTLHFQPYYNDGCGNNGYGGSGMYIIKFIPNVLPIINITQEKSRTCQGELVTFNATITSSSFNFRYNWIVNNTWPPNGETINSQLKTTQFTTNSLLDKDSVSLYVYDNSCGIQKYSDTLIQTVIDCSFATALSGLSDVTPNQQNVTYSVLDKPGFSYQWSVVGGTIQSGQGTHSIAVDWNISGSSNSRTTASVNSVTVVETNQSAQSKSTTLEINFITTNTESAFSNAGIQLYPNPSTESFNINIPESGVFVEYTILTISGTQIQNGSFTSSENIKTITTDFTPGLYLLRIKYNGNMFYTQFNKCQ